jgi:hypothetical protein
VQTQRNIGSATPYFHIQTGEEHNEKTNITHEHSHSYGFGGMCITYTHRRPQTSGTTRHSCTCGSRGKARSNGRFDRRR